VLYAENKLNMHLLVESVPFLSTAKTKIAYPELGLPL